MIRSCVGLFSTLAVQTWVEDAPKYKGPVVGTLPTVIAVGGPLVAQLTVPVKSSAANVRERTQPGTRLAPAMP